MGLLLLALADLPVILSSESPSLNARADDPRQQSTRLDGRAGDPEQQVPLPNARTGDPWQRSLLRIREVLDVFYCWM